MTRTVIETARALKRSCRRAVCSIAALAGVCIATPSAASEDFYFGQIIQTAASFCPRGTTEADGRLLDIQPHGVYLFSLYGTLFGGDGRTTFGLPDLPGPDKTLLYHERTGLRWCVVAWFGQYPPRDDTPPFSAAPSGLIMSTGANFCPQHWRKTTPGVQPKTGSIIRCEAGTDWVDQVPWYLAQIVTVNAQSCPANMMRANGQELQIVKNQSLFSLLYTVYGGDGKFTFNLPNVPSPGAGEIACVVTHGLFPSRN